MVPSPRSRQSESETLNAADDVDNVDTYAQLEQQGRPASSSIVLYSEPDEDEDEDEQLFIETIRRGTLAVQQRRRRLLSRPALTPAGDALNGSVSDQLNSLSAGALSMPPLSQRSPGPRLQPEMLPPISLLSTTRTRRLSQVQATSSNTSATSFWLLYCAPPASTSDALTNKGPVFVQSALIARDRLGGGGCGRLVCARGQLSTDDDPGTYRSDAPPSHQALDWLDVILPQDDHHHWPHSCDCIQATLGCRNCGNVVGMSTLFRCSPCRRNQSAASDWTFWTTLAMPRLDNLPIPLQLSVVTAGMQNRQILASNSNARLEQDQEAGLAGIAHEWASRSEALFNASPLPVLEFKVGRGSGRSMCEAEENEEHHEGVEAGPAQSGRRTSRRQRSGGQTGMRAMRPGFGMSRAADVGGDNAYISGSWNIWSEDSVGEGGTSRRRRRLSLHLGIDDDEDEGAPTGEEREFRRRRTAEILESGQIKQDGAREVYVPLPSEPVGR